MASWYERILPLTLVDWNEDTVLKRDGIASRLAMALKILLSHILIAGLAWRRWCGESRSGPAELSQFRCLMAALISLGANGTSRMNCSSL